MNTAIAQGRDVRDDLARPRGPLAVFLLAALAALSFSMITLVGVTVARLTSNLESRLSGQLTIVIWGHGLESVDAAAARASERLAAQPGVRRATVLEAAQSDPMVSELIAGGSRGGEGPRLLSLSGAPDAIPSASRLKQALNADHLVAAIDDHRGMGAIERRALVGAGLVVVFGLALALGSFVMGLLSGGRMVRTAHARFDLMSRLGAEPAFVAAIVGRRAGFTAFVGGVVGTIVAGLIPIVATIDQQFWRTLGSPPYLQPDFRDCFWILPWPVVVMAIAALGGNLGARRMLARRERSL